MLPFHVTLAPGDAPARQIVFAAVKAILSGVIAPGDPFPSVRDLSEALRINPNTAQKVVAELVRDGFLAVHHGVGTVVTDRHHSTDPERRRLLTEKLEQAVVDARRVGMNRDDLLAAVDAQWTAVFGADRKMVGGSPRAARGPTRGGPRR
jgi:GntR family transcriptional regulator